MDHLEHVHACTCTCDTCTECQSRILSFYEVGTAEDSTEYTLGTDHRLSLIGKEIFVSVIVHFPMKVEKSLMLS